MPLVMWFVYSTLRGGSTLPIQPTAKQNIKFAGKVKHCLALVDELYIDSFDNLIIDYILTTLTQLSRALQVLDHSSNDSLQQIQ